MNSSLRDRLLTYLREHHVMSLATTGTEGPWAAAVFYVNDATTLYFLSSPGSRHCRNLTMYSRVAVTIQEDYPDWPSIKGIQLEGTAIQIGGDEEVQARALYGEKFPVVGKLAHAPAAIVKAMAKVRWYKVVPETLYFIDNAVGFGNRERILCEEGTGNP